MRTVKPGASTFLSMVGELVFEPEEWMEGGGWVGMSAAGMSMPRALPFATK